MEDCETQGMIVTIDGPAGAGKSSVARALAGRLSFAFLDTGAMYRAVALAAIREGIDWEHSSRLQSLAESISIELSGDKILLDGEDVGDLIRQPDVTSVIHHVADNPAIRRHLVELQRRTVRGRDFVSEGRDQGTVAFPDACCKIYLTASSRERAWRRQQQLRDRGIDQSLDEILCSQEERDRRDSQRSVGRLAKADDAIEISSDELSLEQVADRLEAIVRRSLQDRPSSD